MATPDEQQRNPANTDTAIAYAFGDPIRIALLRALSRAPGSLTASSLAAEIRSELTAVDEQLAPLVAEEVVIRGGGRIPTYRLSDHPLARTIRDMARATVPPDAAPSVAHGTFDVIFDQVNSGIAIYDAAGALVRVNAAGERITKRAVLAGKSLSAQMSRNRLRDAQGNLLTMEDTPVRRVLRGEVVSQLEYVIAGVRGQDIWLRSSASPLKDAQGDIHGVVVIFEDITDQRALVREEARQRRLASAMIEYTFSGMAIFDIAPPYRCLQHNENFLRLYGGINRYPQGTLEGLSLDDTFEGDALDRIRAIFDGVISSGEPFLSNEYQYIRPTDPLRRWYRWRLTPLYDDAGHMTQLLSVVLEITELVTARDRSRRAAQELRTILESLPEAVLLTDNKGQFILSNPAAEQILGREVEPDATAQGYAEAFKSLGTDGHRLLVGELPLVRALHGETVIGEEITIEHEDGRRVDLLVSSAPVVYDDSGAIGGAVSVFQDITHLKELERQRDDFLGIAAHELRTPLATILATLQAFQRRLNNSITDPAIPDETLAAGLDRMQRQAQRLNTLVTDLLDTTRIRTGTLFYDLEPTDLVTAVREAVVGQISANLGRTISLSLPKEPVMVMGDSSRLAQIVDNLVANALKYSQNHQPVLISLSAGHGMASLVVTDKGVGIPAKYLEHLFDRFYRVPGVDVQYGPRVGLGLGLHITHTLVERHGGQIDVRSEPGQGTTFLVSLPLLERPEEKC
jgi:PAS domain S-box-containing protein